MNKKKKVSKASETRKWKTRAKEQEALAQEYRRVGIEAQSNYNHERRMNEVINSNLECMKTLVRMIDDE